MGILANNDVLYGIIDGPKWNNFNVCSPEFYICTFECADYVGTGDNRRWEEWIIDLYVITYPDGRQSYLYRQDEEWEGSYGSGPIQSLFNIKWKPWTQILYILCNLGHFQWKKN